MSLTQTIKDKWNEHKLKKDLKNQEYKYEGKKTMYGDDVARLLASLPIKHEVKRLQGNISEINNQGTSYNPRNIFDEDYFKLGDNYSFRKKKFTFVKDNREKRIISIKDKNGYETVYAFEINPSEMLADHVEFWNNGKFRILYNDFNSLCYKVFNEENDFSKNKEILKLKINYSGLDSAIEQIEKDLSTEIYKERSSESLSVKCLYEGTLEILKSVKDNPESKPELTPKMNYLKNMFEVVKFIDEKAKNKESKLYIVQEIGELVEVSKEPFIKTFSRLKNFSRKTDSYSLDDYARFCKNAIGNGWDLDETDKIIFDYKKNFGNTYSVLERFEKLFENISDIEEFKTLYKQSKRLLKAYLENGGRETNYYITPSLFQELANKSNDKRKEHVDSTIKIIKYAKKELSKDYTFMGDKYKQNFGSFFINCVHNTYFRGDTK